MNELRQRKVSELSSAEPAYHSAGSGSSAPRESPAPMAMRPKLRDVKAARSKLFRHVGANIGRLALKLRMLYSAPQVAIVPVSTLLSIYSVPLYESLGASLQYLAFFMAITRSLDLVMDPLISYITDSFRGPFGRRRPFMFVGCWVYSLMLVLLLSPPKGLGSFSLSMWFGLTSVGFYTASSFTIIPYDAFGMELAASYNDRTLQYYTSAVFEFAGSLMIILLSQAFYSASSLDTARCSNSSCFSMSGVGQACLPRFDDRSVSTYDIFDVFGAFRTAAPSSPLGFSSDICTFRNGTKIANPATFFQPLACTFLEPVADGDTLSGSVAAYAPWTPAQLRNYQAYSWRERTTQCLRTYCTCTNDCNTACTADETRLQYSHLSFVMGAWFVVSMCVLTFYARERAQLMDEGKLPPPWSPFTAMVNALRNVAFRRMLPTFVCDNASYSIVTGTMLYFVKYIIQPEKQSRAQGNSIDCNGGVPTPGTESASWRCNSTNVLGAVLVVMLGAALVACPVWYFAAVRWGKRNIWLAWSLLLIVALLLLLVVDKGEVDLSLYLSVVPGAIMGAKFVGLSILSDVIEYDEYLTGQRSEASYVMLKSFLPKLFAIPALTFPLVLISSLEPYSPAMTRTVYAMIIWVPFSLMLISIYYKFTMPLRYKKQSELIADGIGLHILGLPSPDPLTGIEYDLPRFSAAERRKVDVLDHFPYREDAEGICTAMLQNKFMISAALLIERSRDQSAYLFFLLICFLTGVVLTWTFFADPKRAIYPIMLSVCASTTVLFLVFSLLRLRAAKRFKRADYRASLPLVEKVIEQRVLFERLNRTRTVDIVGISESQIRLRMSLKHGLGMQEHEALIGDEDANSTSESDGDDEQERELDPSKRNMKKGQSVVAHWRAIINTNSANSKATRVIHTTKTFSETLREMMGKITAGKSVEHTYPVENPTSIAPAAPAQAVVLPSDAASLPYMAEAANPIAWDMELHSFVKDQAALNAKRSAEEVDRDILYSDTIGAREDEDDGDANSDDGRHAASSSSGSDKNSDKNSDSSSEKSDASSN